MKVYALIGKSGTGKSYQSGNLCRELNIETIIDDGILIYGNDIIAGESAKRQATKIGAIRTALFTKEEHRLDVVNKIRELSPHSLLIIGTSDEMVERIRARLDLPELYKRIYIEDITTEKERAEAQRQRNELGKHVIPVSTFALKRDFSGYLVDPLKIIRTWGRKGQLSEKSVVRPTYSYRGDYVLSDKVISDIIVNVAGRNRFVKDIVRTDTKRVEYGIAVSIQMIAAGGYNIMEEAEKLQLTALEKIEMMTAFNVFEINIEIKGIA